MTSKTPNPSGEKTPNLAISSSSSGSKTVLDGPGLPCYVFNAISEVIDASGLDEIRDHINELGEGEKTLGKLKPTEVFSWQTAERR